MYKLQNRAVINVHVTLVSPKQTSFFVLEPNAITYTHCISWAVHRPTFELFEINCDRITVVHNFFLHTMVLEFSSLLHIILPLLTHIMQCSANNGYFLLHSRGSSRRKTVKFVIIVLQKKGLCVLVDQVPKY